MRNNNNRTIRSFKEVAVRISDAQPKPFLMNGNLLTYCTRARIAHIQTTNSYIPRAVCSLTLAEWNAVPYETREIHIYSYISFVDFQTRFSLPAVHFRNIPSDISIFIHPYDALNDDFSFDPNTCSLYEREAAN